MARYTDLASEMKRKFDAMSSIRPYVHRRGGGRGTSQITGWEAGRPIYGQPKQAGARQRTTFQAFPTTGARREVGRKPQFGQYPTLTSQQQTILSQLMKGGLQGKQAPVAPVSIPRTRIPTVGRPTYGAAALGGAGERAGTLSRMMGVSPEEERMAIERMSAPAMRQFREEILPGIRGTAGATGTLWSTMRAGEEAKAGAGLAEGLASMGEQYRMQRRGQAMQAAGLSAQEALGAGQLGQARYATEMQPYMQAQQLGAQAGLQTQRLGVQAGLQAQLLGAQRGGQREQMLAQLLGIPMMGVYSYPRGRAGATTRNRYGNGEVLPRTEPYPYGGVR